MIRIRCPSARPAGLWLPAPARPGRRERPGRHVPWRRLRAARPGRRPWRPSRWRPTRGPATSGRLGGDGDERFECVGVPAGPQLFPSRSARARTCPGAGASGCSGRLRHHSSITLSNTGGLKRTHAVPPFWTPAGVGLALRRARLNGVLCRAAGSAVCSLDGQPPGASIRGAFEAVAADPRERGYGLPCCCFGLAFFGLGGRAGRGPDAEPGPRDGAVADRVGQRPGEGIVIMPPATRLPLCTQIALFCLACLHRPRHRAGCVSCWL